MDGDSLILFTFFFFTFLATLWSPHLPHLSNRSSSSIWKPFRHFRNVRSKFLLPLIVFLSFSLSTAFLFKAKIEQQQSVHETDALNSKTDVLMEHLGRLKCQNKRCQKMWQISNNVKHMWHMWHMWHMSSIQVFFSQGSFVRLVFVLFWGVWAAWWTALSRQQVLKWPRPRRKSSKIERFGRRESRKKSTEWKWMKVKSTWSTWKDWHVFFF